jgi:hypothetical protein
MVASDIEKLIDPTVANGITASLFAFFTIGFLLHPYQMVRGTKWPKGESFFKEGTLPTAEKGPLYVMLKFFSIVQLTTFVVPAIIEPHSQYLTYFTCIVMTLNILHQIVAFSGLIKVYKDVIPDTKGGKIQIAVGMVMSVAVLVVNVLACLHEGGEVPFVASYYAGGTRPHHLPINVTNIIMLAFAAINGIQLIIAPTHFMSTWFGAPKEDLPADYKPKKFMGFDVLPENGCLTIMARNMGIYFISQCLVFAVHPVDGVSSMIYHPLITLGWFMFFCTITIDNLHGLQLQDSDGPTPKHYKMTWIPQLIFGIGLCVIMLLTFVRVAPNPPIRDSACTSPPCVTAAQIGDGGHLGHHALYDAAKMYLDAIDTNLLPPTTI